MPPIEAAPAPGDPPVASAALTRDEVASRGDELLVVGSGVYSVKGLAESHPGGEFFVRLFGGRDATTAFVQYHRRSFPAQRMSTHLVAPLSGEAVAEDAELLELAAAVDTIIREAGGGFAPWTYYVKAGALLLAAVGLELGMLVWGRNVLGSVVLGVLFACIGLNIQHDANHGALSRRPWVNTLFGLAQDWIGGSRLLWAHQHVVLHHIFTNHHSKDPDITADPLLKLRPMDATRPYHMWQHLYIFGVYMLFGVKVTLLAISELWDFRYCAVDISPAARRYRAPALYAKLFFVLRFFALPLAIRYSRRRLLDVKAQLTGRLPLAAPCCTRWYASRHASQLVDSGSGSSSRFLTTTRGCASTTATTVARGTRRCRSRLPQMSGVAGCAS